MSKKLNISLGIGFVIEVLLFILTGLFLAIGSKLAFVILILGFIVAYIVGKGIAINAVEEYFAQKNE